jgi:hypothetical protein
MRERNVRRIPLVETESVVGMIFGGARTTLGRLCSQVRARTLFDDTCGSKMIRVYSRR